MLPIHVDDLLLASNSADALRSVKSDLAAHFKLHDLGPATSILGMKIVRDRPAHSISLSQPGYTESILSNFSMADCNPALTPMEEGCKLSVSMSPQSLEEKLDMKDVPYRELVGKLLYLAIATRPDISYAIGVLCRFVENPGRPHWDAAKRVLRYLRGTTDMALVYSRPLSPDLFTTFAMLTLAAILTTAGLRVALLSVWVVVPSNGGADSSRTSLCQARSRSIRRFLRLAAKFYG